MKLLVRMPSLLLFWLLVCVSPMMGQTNVEPILLWPNGAPGATGTSDEDKPAIIPVLPVANMNTGAAVLICPGGGFMTRATDFEGVLVSRWLKERGIASFILRYRIRPMYERKDWLADAQRAMQYIRANAKQFQVASDRIGIIGFSAGADLAYDASLHPLAANASASEPLESVSSRPDFQVLVYGASPQRETDNGLLASLPPAFMFCTLEDLSHLQGMAALHTEMVRAKIPVEAHFYQNGEHGVGFALGDPVLGTYPQLMLNWLKGNGFLTAHPRLALSGNVKLDGKPLVRGIVTLTPLDDTGAAPVVIYMTNTGTGPLGNFTVRQSQGPVAGRYRVEVRQDATRWLSNSRDPVMIKMQQKLRDKTLTEDDRKEWAAHVRQRDLSPSLDRQRIFARQRPQDKTEYIVSIRPNSGPLMLEIFSQ